jgi:uncharacterized protein
MFSTYLTIVTVALMLVGLVGVVLPILPGIPYMLILAAIFAVLTGFSVLTWTELTWLIGLAILSVGIDAGFGLLGAKFGGASGKSLLVGTLGLVLGMVLLPPLGGIVGMFLGIVGGEVFFYGRTKTAIKAASGGVLGTIISVLLNLLIGLVFVGLFILFTISTK